MENGSIAILRVGEDLADGLASAYFVACLYIDLAQVTINREVVTVAYNHRVVVARDNEYTRHFAIEYGTCVGSGRGLDVDAAIVGTDVFKLLVLLLAKGTYDGVAAGDGERQTPTVAGKVVG